MVVYWLWCDWLEWIPANYFPLQAFDVIAVGVDNVIVLSS